MTNAANTPAAPTNGHPNFIKGWNAYLQVRDLSRLQHNAARVAPHWTRGFRAAAKAVS